MILIQKMFEKFRLNGFLLILYALLIEAILLILLSFAGLFTLETILPGLISGHFVIGKLIIIVSLLIFFTAYLGRKLGISFPLISSRPPKIFSIGIGIWTIGILTLSLLAFPTWSIPLFLISFGAIAYLAFKEFKLNS